MRKAQLDKSNGGHSAPSEVISRYLEALYYMWSEGEPPRQLNELGRRLSETEQESTSRATHARGADQPARELPFAEAHAANAASDGGRRPRDFPLGSVTRFSKRRAWKAPP